jgi:hypothetical protein
MAGRAKKRGTARAPPVPGKRAARMHGLSAVDAVRRLSEVF